MKAFFEDMFKYHSHFNQMIIQQMIENENLLTDRSIPLLFHTLNALQIWNARILQNSQLNLNEIFSLEKCTVFEAQNHSDTLHIIKFCDLDEIVNYSNSKGDNFSNTVQEILFHAANHFTHHRGQLVSDLRQVGVVPIATDYIFYKRE